MKKITLIIFCFFALNMSSQNDKTAYKASGIYVHYFSSNPSKLLTTVPVGKNVELIYDSFFKTWTIRYDDKDGQRIPMKLSFIQKDQFGNNRMKDTYDHMYTVATKIDDNKSLFISLDEVLDDGKTMAFEIKDINVK